VTNPGRRAGGEPRGQLGDRPRVPWGGPRGIERQTSDAEAIMRIATVVLALLNPLTAVLSVLAVVTATRTPAIRRQRAGRLFAGVVTIGVLALGTARLYAAPFIDLADAITSAPAGGRQAAAADTAAERWPTWLLKQLPVAIPVAITLAVGVLWRRQRYEPRWRKATPPAKPAAVAAAMAATDQRAASEAAATRIEDVELRLGADVHAGEIATLPGGAITLHTVILGPTGFGKSTTIDRITWELLGTPVVRDLHNPHVMIDMKGEPDVIEYRRRLAEATGRRCHVVTVDGRYPGSTTYNPLRHGTPSELRSKLLGAEEGAADGGFSEPYYLAVGKRWLLLVCEVLIDLVDHGRQSTVRGQRRPWRRDLPDAVRLMQPKVLHQQVSEVSPAIADRIMTYFETADEDLIRTVSGIYERYADMVEGAAAGVLVDSPTGVDLYQAIQSGDIVVFSLDAASDRTVARQLGNLVLQDLRVIGARLQQERFRDTGRRVLVFVDEFSALGGSALLDFYTRARSAGIITGLATQASEDFRAVSDQFDAAVRTSANVFILHRQKHGAAAEWAESIGTTQGFQETLQVTEEADPLGTTAAASGVGSLRVVDRFIVHPNELKTLPQGEAYILVGHPTTSQRRVRIVPAPQLPGTTPHAAGDIGSGNSWWRDQSTENGDPKYVPDVDVAGLDVSHRVEKRALDDSGGEDWHLRASE
jgi:hypothetical protein